MEGVLVVMVIRGPSSEAEGVAVAPDIMGAEAGHSSVQYKPRRRGGRFFLYDGYGHEHLVRKWHIRREL